MKKEICLGSDFYVITWTGAVLRISCSKECRGSKCVTSIVFDAGIIVFMLKKSKFAIIVIIAIVNTFRLVRIS